LNIQRPRIRWLLTNIQANGDFACWPIPMPLRRLTYLSLPPRNCRMKLGPLIQRQHGHSYPRLIGSAALQWTYAASALQWTVGQHGFCMVCF
jgi:hypothetical protein